MVAAFVSRVTSALRVVQLWQLVAPVALVSLASACGHAVDEESPSASPGARGTTTQRTTQRSSQPSDAQLQYVVGGSPATGQLDVRVTYRDPPAGALELVQAGTAEHVRFLELEARIDDQPTPIAQVATEPPTFRLDIPSGARALAVRYRALPFGVGHHGRDNIVSAENTLVSGHVFLVPSPLLRVEQESRGRSSVSVSVAVEPPAGLEAVSTYAGVAPLFDPSINHRWALTALGHGNLAFGHFETETRGTEQRLRVHMPASWPAQRRRETSDALRRLYDVFRAQVPCEEVPEYTVLFVPPGPDRTLLAGEFWSNGQAFAPEAYDNPRRVYELAAHRFAHGANKYDVCGIPPASLDEHWFMEAWPVFTEVSHLIQARVTRDDQRLLDLGNTYLNVVFGLSSTVRDRPQIDESQDLSDPEIEYLHYTKSAFVALMLDRVLRERSGGTRNLNDFVRVAYAEHHREHTPFHLYAELDQYAGVPISADFHRDYVASTAMFYPLHDGFLRTMARAAQTPAVPQLRVGSATMSAAQLELHRAFFRTTHLVPEAGVDAHVVSMLRVHNEYIRREAQFVPLEIIQALDVLPASRRYQVFWHEREIMFPEPHSLDAFLEADTTPLERLTPE